MHKITDKLFILSIINFFAYDFKLRYIKKLLFYWDYSLVVPYLFNNMKMCDTFTGGLTRHSATNPTNLDAKGEKIRFLSDENIAKMDEIFAKIKIRSKISSKVH